MVDLKPGRSAALSHTVAPPVLRSGAAERPRDFSFAITWSTLMTHLEPLQAADRMFAPAVEPSNPLALVAVEKTLTTEQNFEPESRARWEMVVPKMVRPPAKTSAPPLSVPAARAALPAKPTGKPFSRTLTAISAARSLLSEEIKEPAAGRELLLSRIVRAIRGNRSET